MSDFRSDFIAGDLLLANSRDPEIQALSTLLCDPEKRAKIGWEIQDAPLRHTFTPGIYFRTILMREGLDVIGEVHLTEHLNILHTGRVRWFKDGEWVEISAPAVFVSKAGVQKVLKIVETCEWSTVHANPDDCRDLAVLEKRLIDTSDNRRKYLAQLETMKQHNLETGEAS